MNKTTNQPTQRNWPIFLAMLVLLGVLLGYLWWSKTQPSTLSLQESDAASAFSAATGTAYTNLAGNEVALDAYLGQVVVVYSWASWCPQCMTELVAVNDLANTFSNDEVAVLAINRSDSATLAQRFLSETIGTETAVQLVLDSDDRFYTTLGGYTMPETVIFAPDGSIAARYRQNFRQPIVTAVVRDLLEATTVTE